MNPSEAQEHLDLVERILERNDRELCVAGDLFLVWGLFGTLMDLLFQLVHSGRIAPQALWIAVAALLFAVAYSAVRGAQFRRATDRMSLRQREYLNILWLAIGVMVVVSIGDQRIFAGWAGGAIWTISAAIVTLYAGLHGNRAGLIGGVVLMTSLVAANFTPGIEGYVLGAGMFGGYAGFGLAAMITRD